MTEKAEPRLMDTGTIVVETKICTNCGQPIERVGPRPRCMPSIPGDEAPAPVRAWVHSDGRSMYCYGRGN